MAVTRINDADLEDIRVKKGLAMLSLTIDASAELAIPADWPTVLLMDPAVQRLYSFPQRLTL